MNMIKLTKKLTVLCLLVFSAQVYAANSYVEKPKFRVDEVELKSIKLANDRTGIIKDVSCYGCNFNMVKITENTKATSKGLPVDILDLKSLSRDTVLGVAFDPITREVRSIDW